MGLGANVRREVAVPVLLLTLWLWTDIQGGEAIWLTVPSTGTKCVSEEIHNNVVVLADYVVVSDDHSHIPTVSVKVTSPYGNNLHHSENVTHGQFAFTTHEAGNYLACLWAGGHNQGGEVSVNLDWKIGIAAKDWESVARKEKIEGIELELRKLEGAVEAIHENLIYLKSREADMRTVSETTNGRVAWFSFMSLGVCIGVSALQVLYLKQFFQKKKLI
ncbi:putative Transmembrane emp24 domain-containing protein 10 precursor [Tripterygium wilfordii]|uniref:Putative Transmembrane emp24 domain-containing protein 10 n=1 Tax=Tripterygium wilfordii TaxID=458696 RepID=A0A7J7CH05_TRIWF|nr:transmembrane emp24 domain-containing protein p24delta3-like [Tripterygium wilfordii]KAF5733311.1 putative Transmembrane emp24 domain-containing protein 10 precursor [Tripterygium wilfordii]